MFRRVWVNVTIRKMVIIVKGGGPKGIRGGRVEGKSVINDLYFKSG